MIAIAAIGVLAFLAGLVVLHAGRPGAGAARPHSSADWPHSSAARNAHAVEAPKWYGFVPALLLVVAAVAIMLWVLSSGGRWVWGESIGDWQSDTRTTAFTAVMVALGIIGLVTAVVFTVVQAAGRPVAKPLAEAGPGGAETPAAPTPSGLRLLGLLLLAVAFLLMCWIALPRADQYALMLQLVYPASLGVALVLLFDKASRTWGARGGAETAREWLLCDALVFVLFLAFLNLRGEHKPEAYGGTFWDLLNVALFFVVFWLIDRKASRFRFLAGYAYFVVLPILLLIWRAVLGIAAPGELSWWSSIWPFFILAVVFCGLEIAALSAPAASGRQAFPIVKDALFVALYAILLIVAASAGGHG